MDHVAFSVQPSGVTQPEAGAASAAQVSASPLTADINEVLRNVHYVTVDSTVFAQFDSVVPEQWGPLVERMIKLPKVSGVVILADISGMEALREESLAKSVVKAGGVLDDLNGRSFSDAVKAWIRERRPSTSLPVEEGAPDAEPMSWHSFGSSFSSEEDFDRNVDTPAEDESGSVMS